MTDPRLWLPPWTEPPTFVLDLSVAATWLQPRLYTDYTDGVMNKLVTDTCVVPQTWAVELADHVRRQVRSGVVTPARVDNYYHNLRGFRIRVDGETSPPAWGDIYDLVRTRRITTFAAAYLELALRRKLLLATTDATLTRAATAAGGPIYTP